MKWKFYRKFAQLRRKLWRNLENFRYTENFVYIHTMNRKYQKYVHTEAYGYRITWTQEIRKWYKQNTRISLGQTYLCKTYVTNRSLKITGGVISDNHTLD